MGRATSTTPVIALRRPGTTEETGEAWGVGLVYSGNFFADVEVDSLATTRLRLGIHPRAHPDQAIRIPSRHRTLGRWHHVLDLGRPEVVDHLASAVGDVVAGGSLDYVMWDWNRTMTEPWSAALSPDRQGEVPHRHVLELDRLALAEDELHQIASKVRFVRDRRYLFQRGRFVRLCSRFQGDGNETASMVIDRDGSRGIAAHYRILNRPVPVRERYRCRT